MTPLAQNLACPGRLEVFSRNPFPCLPAPGISGAPQEAVIHAAFEVFSVAQPRYYAPYYAPAVYVPGPRCWLEHERVWDGYGYVVQRVRVCE